MNEKKSYQNWHKTDDFVYKFLFDKAIQALNLKGRTLYNKTGFEICCGPGNEMLFLKQKTKCKVMGLDISRDQIERARDNHFSVIQGDAEKLPLIECACDFAFVYNGLHHLPNPYVAIHELTRISKEIIIIIDNANPLITKFLNRLGLFKREKHTKMKPNRLETVLVEYQWKKMNIDYIILPCFAYGAGYIKTSIVLKTLFISFNRFLWKARMLGSIFENTLLIIAIKK